MMDKSWDLDELTVAKDRFVTNLKYRKFFQDNKIEVLTKELEDVVNLKFLFSDGETLEYQVKFEPFAIYHCNKPVYYNDFPKKAEIIYRWLEKEVGKNEGSK